jgi:hypothetical protein
MGVLDLKRHVARHISQESREMFAIAAKSVPCMLTTNLGTLSEVRAILIGSHLPCHQRYQITKLTRFHNGSNFAGDIMAELDLNTMVLSAWLLS